MEAATKRQQALLQSLASNDSLIPVKEFAAQFACSEKTIRNDLQALEGQGVIIERVSGKGIRLKSGGSDFALRPVADKLSPGESSTEHRRLEILFELLNGQQTYCSIQSLADKYFVSKTSIVNDLTVIERQLHQYNIVLQKDVHGTKIAGSELNIRKALVDILGYLLHNEKHSPQGICLRIDTATLTELHRHFDQQAIDVVEHIVEQAENILGYQIVEPYYINLITHILISIERIRSDKLLHSDWAADTAVRKSTVYEAAQYIAAELSDNFAIALNQAEIFYIYRYLSSSGGRNYDLDKKSLDSTEVDDMAMEIIDACSHVFPLKFAFSKALYQALLLHLQPMLNRIKYSINIKNPMLEQIKTEFPRIMLLLNFIMLRIRLTHRLPDIHEDEIAYLAVYFQDAFEEALLHKNAVIVCSSGVGTSHLLKKRIKNVFPELNIIDVVSAKHVEDALQEHAVDIVITTVHLDKELPLPVAYVNAFFSKADEAKVKQIFQQQLPENPGEPRIPGQIITAESPELAALTPAVTIRPLADLSVSVYVKKGLKPGWKILHSDDTHIYIELAAASQLNDAMIKSIYYWVEQEKRGE